MRMDRPRIAAVSPYRPDLVDVWLFRLDSERGLEILMLRRAPERTLAGLWQGVSGRLEDGESIVAGALRELREETGLVPADLEAFYDLDQVNSFHVAALDGVVTAAVFAARLGASARVRLSHEHDRAEWVSPDEATRRSVWPAYRESVARIRDHLVDPDLARWFALDVQVAGTPAG
jgi:8-oxo-dGTP pyrophosphatase MutT (NUDIX family)